MEDMYSCTEQEYSYKMPPFQEMFWFQEIWFKCSLFWGNWTKMGCAQKGFFWMISGNVACWNIVIVVISGGQMWNGYKIVNINRSVEFGRMFWPFLYIIHVVCNLGKRQTTIVTTHDLDIVICAYPLFWYCICNDQITEM